MSRRPELGSKGRDLSLEERLRRMAFESLWPPEAVNAQEATRIERARSRLEDFTTFTMPDYEVNWHHHILFEHLDALIKGDILRLMVFSPPQHGKQIADSESILCADGWRTHGELRPGHRVYAPDGRLVRVLAVTEPLDCDVEIELTTGEVIVSHSNHLWYVYDRSRRAWRVISSLGMQRRGLLPANRCRFQLAHEAALAGMEQVLPVHPYALGLWLGDGSTDKGCISYAPEDAILASALVSCGYPLKATWVHRQTGVLTSSFAGIRDVLQDAGILKSKSIPEVYQLASLWQRQQLLAGLIDTDGSYSARSGQYRFTNTNRELIEEVVRLARSLGFRVGTVQRYEPCVSSSGIAGTKAVFVVAFSACQSLPCRLERKQVQHLTLVRRRGIVDVRPCHPQPGRCIAVEGGLYLVGRGLVPTHNSEIVSRRLPAYALGRYPDTRIMACSYNDMFASLMNRDVQRIIDGDAYRQVFPGTELYSKNIRTQARGTYLRNSDIFEVVGRRGFYRSAGIGSGIAGQPFNLGIIDDPIKDDREANSPTVREAIWNWYVTVFSPRKAKAGARILITLTRWHQDDLAGRLLNMARGHELADQWTVVEFPAILEDESQRHATLYGSDPRKIGEALWESRHPLQELTVERIQSGPVKWSAVFQQRPSPAKGVIFNRDDFRHFHVERARKGEPEWVILPAREGEDPSQARRCRASDCQFFQTADAADTAGSSSAFTAVATFGITPWRDLLVWHVWRARLEFPERYRAILGLRDGLGHWDDTHHQWLLALLRPWPRPLLYQAVEAKASGLAILQQGAADGKPFRPLKPGNSGKVERCAAVATLYDAGKVWHRQGEAWLGPFEEELLSFPSGTYADQVDCLAYAGMLLTQDALTNRAVEGELLVWPDQLPRDKEGNILLPSPQQEVFRVGDTEVAFSEHQDWWRQAP